jgi:hypothetical protein
MDNGSRTPGRGGGAHPFKHRPSLPPKCDPEGVGVRAEEHHIDFRGIITRGSAFVAYMWGETSLFINVNMSLL